MEAIAIESTRRDSRGKGAARSLRREGRIPAIAYGHSIEEPVALALDPLELEKALSNPKGANAVFELKIDGEGARPVMVRELQRHPVSRSILHVDLVSPDLEREIIAAVPIRVTGKAAGVQAGGRLLVPYREVKLRARPRDFPATVDVEVTELEQGDTKMVSEVALPDGTAAVYDRDFVVAKVVKPRGQKAKPGEEPAKGPAEAAAAPAG